MVNNQMFNVENLEPVQWVQIIREALTQPIPANPYKGYFDLGSEHFTLDKLLLSEADLPEQDGLAMTFALMVRALASHRLDLLRFGVNEILKSYLRCILTENFPEGEKEEKRYTKRYMEVLRLIFEYARSEVFPFTESLWTYLASCLQTAGLALVRSQRWETASLFLIDSAEMGRIAARDGLPTTTLQHFLRRVENTCLPFNNNGTEPNPHDSCQMLAQLAHNLRFNLEV